MIDDETRYRAVDSRDARFDGVFFTAVTSTGIYCRPSCPAVTPKRANCTFYPTAAAAQGAGFRACRRCRPDSVPGSPEWNHRADLVGRAMRLIGDGVVDREGVAGLATRLGYSARQLQRQLTAELGAGPIALARAQRAQAARLLLQTTELPVTEVAFAAGFASVRQFNDTVREVYDRTPSGLRAEGQARGSRRPQRASPGSLSLRLAYRGPIDTEHLMDFLALRAVPGVEEVVPAGPKGVRSYRRTLRLPNGYAIAEVDGLGTGVPADRGWLDCRLWLTDLRDLTTAVHRLRALFDLDADPQTVAEQLGRDTALGPLVARRPGLRSPGHVDPHELAVRAVLGQQITVAAARTLAGRLAARYGTPLSGGTTSRPEAGEDRAARSPCSSRVPKRWPPPTRPTSRCPSHGRTRCADCAARSRRAPSGWTRAWTANRPPGSCSGCAASARGPSATCGCGRSATRTSSCRAMSACATACSAWACPVTRRRRPWRRWTGRRGARTRCTSSGR